MKNLLKVSVGFLISAFCLWFVLKNFDWNQMREAVTGGQWSWFIPAVVIYVTGFFFRNIRWHALLNPIAPISRLKLFPVLAFGYLVNNVLPARAGEFARTYLAAKLVKKPVSTAFATVVADRLMDFVGLVFLVLIALPVLNVQDLPLKKVALILIAGFLCVGVFIVLSKKLSSKSNKLVELIKTFGDGFRSFQSFRQASGSFLATIVVWTCEVSTVVLFSRIFGLDLSFSQAAALLIGTSIGIMIPAAPGYVGTYELFAQKTLVLMGFPENLSLSFVLVLHFFHLTATSIFGLPYLFKLGSVQKMIQEKEKTT